MNVSLTPELERYVRKKVKSGYYNNASEVVREALRAMIEQGGSRRELAEAGTVYEAPAPIAAKGSKSTMTKADERKLARLRAEIQKGIAAPDDPDFSFDKLRASLGRKRRSKAK